MRIKDVKSLVWLYRWYNGREARLSETRQAHLAAVTQLVLEHIGGTPHCNTEVVVCGFTLTVSPSPDGLALESIVPPTYLSGAQLLLFDADAGEDFPAGQYCESIEGAQCEVAYD